MAFELDESGNLTLVQGDSGTLSITGLDTSRNYIVYFAFQDKDRNPIGTEVSVYSNYKSGVTFDIPALVTDYLTVDKDDEYAEYYYGIKVCDAETLLEDTLIIGNSNMGDDNLVTVYPKKVEGL